MDRAQNLQSGCKRFTGKTVIVTGGGGAIGGSAAMRMAAEGANVVLTDICGQDRLDQVSKEITEATGSACMGVRGDCTKVAEVQEVIKQTVDKHGRVDCLFNNAGYQGSFKPVHEYPDEDFPRVMAINVEGVFYFLKYCAIQMKNQEPQGGAILNTASQAGVDGPPNMAAYTASKSAVIGLTKTASKDLAPHNIRVNALSPAFVGDCLMWDRQCELQAAAGSMYYASDKEEVSKQMMSACPMRRCGSLDEVSGVVAFLLSADSSYVSGSNTQVTGGIP